MTTLCKKCGAYCRPGVALYNPAFPDHPGEGAEATCKKCGHEFTID